MTLATHRTIRLGLALCALVLGTAGAADLKHPDDFAFPQGEGSPRQVTFRHSSHVDYGKPACVTCHPGSFRILEKGRTATGEPIRHAEMEKGQFCGSCHAKTAFNFDDCTGCHQQ